MILHHLAIMQMKWAFCVVLRMSLAYCFPNAPEIAMENRPPTQRYCLISKQRERLVGSEYWERHYVASNICLYWTGLFSAITASDSKYMTRDSPINKKDVCVCVCVCDIQLRTAIIFLKW